MSKANEFNGDFRMFISHKAIQFCQPFLNTPQEEEYVICKEGLLELERFILGSETLSEDGSVSSSVCGKIFKSKEPVYVCRDCATDSTCVFCRMCFVKSEHIKHNYQMFSSNGGGFCDCGDIEAWKYFPRCNLHGGSKESSSLQVENFESLEDVENEISKLPENVKIKFLSLIKQIFENFKYFIMRPLCKEKEDMRQKELSRELSFIKSECADIDTEEYDLVLYNNEIHNFDQVISLFKRCLSCTAEQAMKYANIVDRDGRCVALTMHDRHAIEEKQQDILSRSKMQTKVELLCRLHHPNVLAIQSFLLHTLRWLFEFVNKYKSLRLLLCQYLFFDVKIIDGQIFERSTFIQDIFENHIETWKMARSATANFMMTVVMKETYFKKLFAVEYVKNYQMVVDHYSTDDHNVQDSLISLSCQIFTIISLAKYLLDNNNVLRIVIQLSYDELLKHSKPLILDNIGYPEILSFHKDEGNFSKKFDPFERHLKSLNDIIYLLTSLSSTFIGYEGDEEKQSSNQTLGRWTSQSIMNFMDYFRIFAEILSLIQETNTIEKVIEHHIEQDPQWRTGIFLMYDLVPVITLTSSIITSNDDCWDRAFIIFRQILSKRVLEFESRKIVVFEYCSYKADVVDNNWPNKFISVIKPIHRFMSSLLLRATYIHQLTKVEVDCLFDQALQMVVFTSQQAGNMWIRNGSVPYILSQQMKCLILSSEMFDRDVQLIQQLALFMKPEEFIVKCIHKFDLKHYFTSSSGILSEKKSLIQRVEDFLHLLIITLFFRYRPEVGKDMTREMCFENIILHILCVKSMTHSKIMKKLPQVLQKYPKDKLMEIIDKVADQTKQSQIIMFNAKKCLVATRFDRFSLYYSIQDRNEAELNVRSILNNGDTVSVLTSPEPIDLSEDFSGLYHYLSDACFIRVLDRILLFTNEKRNSEYWTDTMLDMVLYLVGACLMEDLKILDKPIHDRRPLFLETASDPMLNIRIIDSLECLCDKITSDQQLELIKWTIKKWHDVKKKASGMDVDEEGVGIDIENVIAIQHNKIVKADAAKKRREQLMNKMKNMQKKFINENVDLLIDPVDEGYNGNPQVKYKKSLQYPEMDLTCILCQEKSDVDCDRPIVAIAGAWRSTVLAKHPFASNTNQTIDADDETLVPMTENILKDDDTFSIRREAVAYDENNTLRDIDRIVVKAMLPLLDHPEETFITTCGHVMHYDCKTKYMSDMTKHKQTIARTKGVLYPRIYNRCPLCKCVCNIDIPIIREDYPIILEEPNGAMTFDEWVTFFINWTPRMTIVESKKVDRVMHWWDKLGNQLSNIMRKTNTFKPNYSQASDNELMSCLGFRVGLAIKLQPGKLTKETYNKFESVYSSISESSLQDIIELDYSVAYTMNVWEQILSKQHLSLLYDMPERHMIGLSYLIKAVRKSHEQLPRKCTLHSNFQTFLVLLQQMLFDCQHPSLQKVWTDLYKRNGPLFILEVDFNYLMTTLLFMRSSFCGLDYASQSTENELLTNFLYSSSYNFNMVRLIYRYVSVQVLLSLDISRVDNIGVIFSQLKLDNPTIWTEENVDNLYNLRLELSQQVSHSLTLPFMTKYEVAVVYSRAVMPFLRCSTFLLSTLGYLSHPSRLENIDVEFNRLMDLLGLTLDVSNEDLLVPSFKSHLEMINNTGSNQMKTVWNTKLPHIFPMTPPTLIDLPLDFTDVITLCLDRGCSLRQQSAGAVTEMTLCLICGDTFCLNGYCCRYPEDSSLTILNGAQIHARQCHGGYSLFLNTRNSKIVVMFYQARWQIFLDPIYLDKYGENDVDLKKGSPLFLNAEAYGKLQRSWLDHSIGCIVNDSFISNDFFV